MAHLLTLALVLFAGSCYASERIVGGNAASIQTYPFVVQVEFQGVVSGTWSQNCGGTILNNIYVLSAASCFSGTFYEPSLRRIRAGTATRNSGGVVSGIATATNHPSFGVAADYDADITIVRLANFLIFNPTVQQAFIPNPNSAIPDNLAVVLAGWGRTEEGGQPATQLQNTIVFTVNRDECRSRYANLPITTTITDNMLCAGLLDIGGRDACQGDAGGPVLINNIVIGITSFGHSCGNAQYPGVSTFVVPFTNWIVQNAQ